MSRSPIAEYFRDQGASVLLVMDSVTRLAMAQREIGLAAGEPPSQKGYTPSVFNLLPKILERAGNFQRGSITGFFTVLVEGDDFNEPICDAVRGILDGHFILSRQLAGQGHYPAIDILNSVSRLTSAVATPGQQDAARKIRQALAAYRDSEDLIQLGAYVAGSNPALDSSIRLRPELLDFLRQDHTTNAPRAETLTRLDATARPVWTPAALDRGQAMTNLPFPLEKVLDWRRTQLELEEAAFRQRMAVLAAADRARAELEAAAATTEVEVRRWNPVAGARSRRLRRFPPARACAGGRAGRAPRRVRPRSRGAAGVDAGSAPPLPPSGALERAAPDRVEVRPRSRTRVAIASESYLAQWRRSRAAVAAYNEMHDPRHSCRNRSAARAAHCRRRERAAPDDAFPLAGMARARARARAEIVPRRPRALWRRMPNTARVLAARA